MTVQGLSSEQKLLLPAGAPVVPTLAPPTASGPRMNSATARDLRDAFVARAEQVPTGDGRFTLDQVVANLVKGLAQPFVELWADLKAHPVRQIAAFLGMAVLSTLLPLVGTVVAVVELGKAAVKLARGLFNMVRSLHRGEPDNAERAFAGIGEGLTEAAMVGVEQWAEKVIDVNRVLPSAVVTAFQTVRRAIAKLFGFGDESDPT